MKKQTNRTWKKFVLLGLAAWGSLICSASCSPNEASRGEHVEHPVAPGPPPPLTPSSTATAAANASTPPMKAPRDQTVWCVTEPRRPLPSKDLGPLSQDVPDQACSDDLECGDGFCDRGRCAPVWEDGYGQKCNADCPCNSYLCLEGRCRSCLHHADCGKDVCGGGMIRLDFVYVCGMLGPHMEGLMPEPVRPPPPSITPPPQVMRPPPSKIYEQRTGRTLSQFDKSSLDACPAHAWPDDVPKRTCTKDSQCGRAFCDRGRCAAMWTCGVDYGNSCEKQEHCGNLPCIDGLCRSCVSEAECAWKSVPAGEPKAMCRVSLAIAGARECRGPTGSTTPEAQHK